MHDGSQISQIFKRGLNGLRHKVGRREVKEAGTFGASHFQIFKFSNLQILFVTPKF
jgi:hypothetical protein